MKTLRHATTSTSNLVHGIRAAALATALILASSSAFGHGADPTDRAAELLARDGAVAISAAGPYVEAGTFRIRVAAKLGRPCDKLPDGTWLYTNRPVKDSDAQGTLVVRFTDGRVSGLSVVTPEVADVLRAAARGASERTLAANRR
jgi:hypothetical protein